MPHDATQFKKDLTDLGERTDVLEDEVLLLRDHVHKNQMALQRIARALPSPNEIKFDKSGIVGKFVKEVTMYFGCNLHKYGNAICLYPNSGREEIVSSYVRKWCVRPAPPL